MKHHFLRSVSPFWIYTENRFITTTARSNFIRSPHLCDLHSTSHFLQKRKGKQRKRIQLFSVRNKIFDSVEVHGAELWEPPGFWTNLKIILFLSTLQLYSKRMVTSCEIYTRVVQVLRTDLIWIQLRTLRAWLKCGGVNYCIRFSYIFLHDNEIMIVVVNVYAFKQPQMDWYESKK